MTLSASQVGSNGALLVLLSVEMNSRDRRATSPGHLNYWGASIRCHYTNLSCWVDISQAAPVLCLGWCTLNLMVGTSICAIPVRILAVKYITRVNEKQINDSSFSLQLLPVKSLYLSTFIWAWYIIHASFRRSTWISPYVSCALMVTALAFYQTGYNT